MNTPEEREQEKNNLKMYRQKGVPALCLTCGHINEDYDDFCRPFEPKHRRIRGQVAVVECSGYVYGVVELL